MTGPVGVRNRDRELPRARGSPSTAPLVPLTVSGGAAPPLPPYPRNSPGWGLGPGQASWGRGRPPLVLRPRHGAQLPLPSRFTVSRLNLGHVSTSVVNLEASDNGVCPISISSVLSCDFIAMPE